MMMIIKANIPNIQNYLKNKQLCGPMILIKTNKKHLFDM